MATREQNVEVFQDTVAWSRQDPQLAHAILEARSDVFYEDDYPDAGDAPERPELVEVTAERSFEAAQRVHAELPGARIAVLNFANAYHPGGGVTWGSRAQEESLCRTSTLYPLLITKELDDTFYAHHRQLGRAVATDSVVYTSGVVVCKSDVDVPQRLPRRNWLTLDVMTCAAPDLHDTSMADAVLFGYHVKRALHLLDVAAAEGASALVLGAFGCGAFRNDPTVVSRAWHVALGEFPRAFERVTFAVWHRPDEAQNFDAFASELG